MLRKLVADTAGLVKLTGSFYDRYADTHRAIGAAAGAAAAAAPAAGVDGGVAGNKLPRKFCYGYQRETEVGDSYGIGPLFGANSGRRYSRGHLNAAASTTNQPCFAENSRNNLDRTAEHGLGVGVGVNGASAGFGFDYGTEVRDLDRRCYSLLEANAQLCLKLQGLGLEYAGLTRELLDSGSKLVSVFFFVV